MYIVAHHLCKRILTRQSTVRMLYLREFGQLTYMCAKLRSIFLSARPQPSQCSSCPLISIVLSQAASSTAIYEALSRALVEKVQGRRTRSKLSRSLAEFFPLVHTIFTHPKSHLSPQMLSLPFSLSLVSRIHTTGVFLPEQCLHTHPAIGSGEAPKSTHPRSSNQRNEGATFEKCRPSCISGVCHGLCSPYIYISLSFSSYSRSLYIDRAFSISMVE